jgi:AraC-like DNA-binding protein
LPFIKDECAGSQVHAFTSYWEFRILAISNESGNASIKYLRLLSCNQAILQLEVKIYIPHPALQEYVLNISTVDVILPEGVHDVVTPYPPTPFQSLMFYCNNPVSMGRIESAIFEKQPLSVVVGPQFSRVNIKVHRQLSAIRVDFVPGGLYRMLGIPMHELFDGGFNMLDFFGAEIKGINEQLQHLSDLEDGKNIVETFLLNHVASLKAMLPFDSALRLLLHHNGDMSMEKTASLACLSLKQFERKCMERIGMNPKLYARILKFSKAYRIHEAFPQLSWTKIAHEAGYYDQMHMIRDFKVFAGVNPSVIEQQLLSTPLRMQKYLHC